jgi:hypothetical protein
MLSGSGMKAPSVAPLIAAKAEVEPLRPVGADARRAGRSTLFLRA